MREAHGLSIGKAVQMFCADQVLPVVAERQDQRVHPRRDGGLGPRRGVASEGMRVNVVERCFNRLKQFRDLATRYSKRAAYWRSELIIAAAILWLREPLQDRP